LKNRSIPKVKDSLLRVNNRSFLRISIWAVVLCAVSLTLTSCGNNYYFAGRPLPPSGLKNRVMVAVANPAGSGGLIILDAYYDVRSGDNGLVSAFGIAKYSNAFPQTIQNLPEQQRGGVYSAGDGVFTLINYAAESGAGTISGLDGPSSSIYTSHTLQYVIAANQTAHVATIIDEVLGRAFYLNLPGVYRVSINASGSVALAFTQDTDNVYSIVHLTATQQTAAANSPDPQHFVLNGQTAQDCEPQSLPVYCAFQVTTAAGASFSRPVKALFSSDGSSAYVLNCGPECGGTQAGITTIPITAASLNSGAQGPSGISLVATSTTALPGGATNALQNGNTLYVAGQQLLSDGLLTGNLTIVNTTSLPLTPVGAPIPISDGVHNKMAFADDNTLWIGSVRCQTGVRGTSGNCLTMFNTSTNSVALFPPFQGDVTGLAPILGLHKIYTAEGGQIYIYNTTDGTQRDNSYVTVSAVASDMTYMDAPSDGDNTTY
jgi:hypothetical protein